jgi:hypothetical protein
MTRAHPARLLAVCASVSALMLFAASGHARPEHSPAPAAHQGSVAPSGCDALTGGEAVHEANARWRQRSVLVRDADGERWEVWVRGLDAKAPRTTTLRGLEVITVHDDDGERVARVRLSAGLERLCGTRTVELRVDDSVGHGQRVLAIGEDGLLLARERKLMFVPSDGASPPDFDVVYQSTFRIAPSNTVDLSRYLGLRPR